MNNTKPAACDNCEYPTSQLTLSADNAAVGLEWWVCPNCDDDAEGVI